MKSNNTDGVKLSKEQLQKLKNEEIDILNFISEFCKKNELRYVLIGGTLLGAIRHSGFIPWDDDVDIAMPRKDFNKFIEMFKENDEFYLDCYKYNKNYWLPFIKVRKKNTEYVENHLSNYNGSSEIWVDIFPLDNGGMFDKFKFQFVSLTRSILCKKNNVYYEKRKGIKKVIFNLLSCLPSKIIIFLQYHIMTLSKNNNSNYILNLGSQYGYKKQKHLREKYFPESKALFENKEYFVPSDYKYVLKKIYGDNYMALPPMEKRITHNPIYVKFSDGEEVKINEKI